MTNQQASKLFSIFGAAIKTMALLAGVNGLATGETATTPMLSGRHAVASSTRPIWTIRAASRDSFDSAPTTKTLA